MKHPSSFEEAITNSCRCQFSVQRCSVRDMLSVIAPCLWNLLPYNFEMRREQMQFVPVFLVAYLIRNAKRLLVHVLRQATDPSAHGELVSCWLLRKAKKNPVHKFICVKVSKAPLATQRQKYLPRLAPCMELSRPGLKCKHLWHLHNIINES